jgi:UDP:flavonoid glycosyltransferase YjiC (YdhE family)
MRVLFTSLPATGHLNSLLPLAEGLADAGHMVAIASSRAMSEQIHAAGFEHLVAGSTSFDALLAGGPPTTEPDRWKWAQRIAFATRAVESALPDVERHVGEWRPDVIVRETAEFAGCLAAEQAGLPHASVATGSWSARDDRRPVVAEVLQDWRARLGMPPDPSARMVSRYLSLAFTPPAWDGDAVHPGTAHFIRYTNPRIRRHARPAWLDERRDRPLVFASLGTVQHAAPGVFEAILDAVVGEPVEVVASIGRDQEAGRFGDVPPNVRIEPFVPQIAVLEQTSVFITHGGFNSAKEALSLGVPLVVVPITPEQGYTAERVEALGMGRRVSPEERTPDVIRARVREVLADATYRSAAGRFAAEMAALPGIDHAVALLEQLARDGKPIRNGSRVASTRC